MINTQTLKAVFFDADDTLYRVRDSVGTRYHPYFTSFGINTTPEEIDKVIPIAWEALSKSYENREEKYKTSHDRDQEVWREYVSYVLEHFTDRQITEELFQAIYHEFGKAESRELMPHVKELVIHLRKRGMITGVLTNNDKRIHELVPGLGLSNHFDHIFCASDIGYKKPATELFRALEDVVNCNPNEMLYVGDCLKSDMAGGKQAGWQVLWYSKNSKKNQDFPHVHCFREAKELF